MIANSQTLVLARENGLSIVSNVEPTLIYSCSVTGEGSTVWRGSAFDCPSSNDSIILRHTTAYNATSGTCNNGFITWRGVSVVGDCFISQLSIDIWAYIPDLEGTNITCVYDNGSIEVVIGTISIVPERINHHIGKSMLLRGCNTIHD